MTEDKDNNTILIIEDDPLNTRLIVDLLQINGFKTLSFQDGKSALQAMEDIVPGLILLDINMPGMNGFEVHKKIRQDSRLDRVKVIAVSGSVMKEDEQRITAEGFDDFMPKPIDIKELLKKIRGYLPA
jgi:CheY-like chemotaxis protein